MPPAEGLQAAGQQAHADAGRHDLHQDGQRSGCTLHPQCEIRDWDGIVHSRMRSSRQLCWTLTAMHSSITTLSASDNKDKVLMILYRKEYLGTQKHIARGNPKPHWTPYPHLPSPHIIALLSPRS